MHYKANIIIIIIILAEAVGNDAVLTVAGGVTTLEEIAELDRMGVEAQVTIHCNVITGTD